MVKLYNIVVMVLFVVLLTLVATSGDHPLHVASTVVISMVIAVLCFTKALINGIIYRD